MILSDLPAAGGARTPSVVLSSGVKSDQLFPTTHATWLTVQLDALEAAASNIDSVASGPGAAASKPQADRALREVREHVMRRYYEPLCAYLGATSYRDVDAPAALVAGFFVERFADAANLRAWRASGMPLRRWLANGLLLWVRTELRHRRRRVAREQPLVGDRIDAGAASAEAIFEREWARGIVSDACEQVARELAAAGESQRWTLFARHVIDGRTYDEIAREFGVASADARNAARVVRGRIDRALEQLLLDEGVPPGGVADELRRIHAHFALGGGEA